MARLPAVAEVTSEQGRALIQGGNWAAHREALIDRRVEVETKNPTDSEKEEK